MSEQIRTARLEAIAMIRAALDGDHDSLGELLAGTDDLLEVAGALSGIAATVILKHTPDPARILDGWTAAALAEGGDQ